MRHSVAKRVSTRHDIQNTHAHAHAHADRLRNSSATQHQVLNSTSALQSSYS